MTLPESGRNAAADVAAEAARAAQDVVDARAPLPLFDRELSWLEFNRRVFAEAESDSVPLLERLKFVSIAASNLDEFFMIRVGEVRDLAAAGRDGSAARAKLDAIRVGCHDLLGRMYRRLSDALLPELRTHGIRIQRTAELGKKDLALVAESFTRDLEPILTPLAIDPGHPFPLLANLALNLAILLESERGETHVAILRVPDNYPRFVRLSDPTRYVPLEDVIAAHANRLFPGLKVRQTIPFRIIRNSDLAIEDDDVRDLLQSVESELRRRERSEVVWLEIEGDPSESLMRVIVQATGLTGADIFAAAGPLRLRDLMQIYRENPLPELLDPPFNPRIPTQLATSEDIFSIIRRGDILLHRPYDSFMPVVEFVQAAAEDPDVMAIKQTLYRTDPGSPIVAALAKAAERGKQVTAVVELQARFDEKKNITWARHLEQAGVQVVYGLVGLKTHCKLCLVVRREGKSLRRYLHLSTGNYNAVTGRLYTDIDLFTCDPAFGADAAQLTNLLTGFSVGGVQELIESRKQRLQWKRFVVSPMDYLPWVLRMIEREIAHATAGKAASIIAKMNAIVEPGVIDALYRASRAGVQIDLMVRGACCLVPGLKGYSENIRVVSAIDRFLEHSRIFRFENGGEVEIYASSGDWMPRNFIRRMEITFPIRDEELIKRFERQILPISLADNVKSWTLDSKGVYRRRVPGHDEPLRSQETFIRIARAESVSLGPYDEIIRRPGTFRRNAKKKRKH